MNDDATMNENVPEKYQGLTREDCREEVLKDLKDQGLLLEIKPLQWFAKMRPFAYLVLGILLINYGMHQDLYL